MKEIIHNDWQTVLADQFQAPYYLKLREFIQICIISLKRWN